MTGQKPATKLFLAAAVSVTGLLAATGSALAGTADYQSTATFGIPADTGQAGLPSQVFVPPGRTAVQSLQLTKVGPSYPVSGGGDFQLRLKGPDGTEVSLITNGCATYPNTSAFTISDSATNPIDGNGAFCTALNGGNPTAAGKPTQPLSAFNGKSSGGVWTATVVDAPLGPQSGSWNGWTLEINHANPTLKGDPAPFKIKKKFAIAARCDANCTVTTGGAAGATTTALAANTVGTIIAPANKKAQRKGKGVVTLTATDETGGTSTTTVNAKTLKIKKKPKKLRP